MLGKIQPAFFPQVFGPNGDEALDAAVVRAQVRRRSPREIERRHRHRRQSPEAGRRGLRARSRSPTWPTRSSSSRCSAATTSPATRSRCFGGAGGQHACLVADELGMKRVYIHPLAGVLSAYGMGLAQVRALREEAVERRLDDAAIDRRRVPRDAARDAVRRGARRAGRRGRARSTSACTSSTTAPTPRSPVPLGAAGGRCAPQFERRTARASASSCRTARWSSRRSRSRRSARSDAVAEAPAGAAPAPARARAAPWTTCR